MSMDEMLTALWATVMQSVAEGVFTQQREWTMIWIGAAIAVAIIILDQILKAKDADFSTPVMSVAVGIYLQIELSVPIFVGGMIAYFAGKRMESKALAEGRNVEEAKKKGERNGLLFSSGLITGEALLGIILAIPFAIQESTDALRIVPESFAPWADWLGGIAMVLFIVWLYKVAKKTS
jgi:putative OPT family oligopeptide transporter